MKRYFSCSIRGRDVWKTVLPGMIFILLALIPLELALMNLDSPHKNPHRALTVAGCFAFGIALALVIVIVAVRLLKAIVPAISIGGKKFSFASKSRRALSLFSGNFEFAGERIRFIRGGATLFRYVALGLVVPIAVWALAFFSLGAKITTLKNAPKPDVRMIMPLSILEVAVFFLLFFVAIPFGCLILRWTLEAGTKENQVRFTGTIGRASTFIALQTALTILTFGVYWPVQAIKTWKYYASRVAWKKQTQETETPGLAGFDGSLKKGFALLCAQALLCAISLGLYFPWALARCVNYFIGHTFIEEK